MNRNKLIQELAHKTGIEQYRIKNILTKYEDIIIEHLKDGDDIHLHGFVTFHNKKNNEKIYANPKTGERKKIKSRNKLKVVVSDTLNKTVNGIAE